MPLKGINKSFINQVDDKKKGLPQLKKWNVNKYECILLYRKYLNDFDWLFKLNILLNKWSEMYKMKIEI
jgi:hypothetical protein